MCYVEEISVLLFNLCLHLSVELSLVTARYLIIQQAKVVRNKATGKDNVNRQINDGIDCLNKYTRIHYSESLTRGAKFSFGPQSHKQRQIEVTQYSIIIFLFPNNKYRVVKRLAFASSHLQLQFQFQLELSFHTLYISVCTFHTIIIL